MGDASAAGKDSTIVGSFVFTLHSSGGCSVGGLEDTGGGVCLRPAENPGLLLAWQRRRRHLHRWFRRNLTPHFSWSAAAKLS